MFRSSKRLNWLREGGFSWFKGFAVVMATPVAIGAGTAFQQAEPGLVDLLKTTAKYVAEYEHQVSAVVSEETYVQRYSRKALTDRGVRRLKSDVLIINDEVVGWIGFRDVYEVDGKPVRDRDERLKRLFIEPSADSYDQALRIARESARYNLVEDVVRTINIPMMALRFIAADRQSRSHFKLEDVRSVNGVRSVVVKFDEFERPRVIETPDEAAAHGRFWIDPDSGRILRSELEIETGSVVKDTLTASVRAAYGYIEKIDLWMPITMDEEYRVAGTVVEGHATYANFRKFKVDTNTIIK